MFDSLTPSDWIQIAVVALTIIVPLGYWMFKMERHASSTATYVEFMSKSIASNHADNEKSHDIIHRRIDATNEKVDIHGEKLSKHEVHLETLLGKGHT